MPMTLGEVGIDNKRVEEMAKHVVETTPLDKDAFAPLTEKDIVEIITASL